MNLRRIASMTMLVSLVLLLVNSIILYIVPEGRVAYWSEWRLLGLSKTEWTDQHVTVGVLFLVAGILHIFFNWSAITAYLKNKAREIRIFTGSFNIALLVTLLVAVGTYFQLPPMSTIVEIGREIKESGAERFGEPPYGHAELSSLNMFAKKEGLDASLALQLLQKAGLSVADGKETLKVIAANNRLTPQQVYEIIKPAQLNVEVPAVQGQVEPAAPALPDHPRPGFGRKSLAEVCAEYGLAEERIVAGLNSMGIACTGSKTIKEIAEANSREPMEVFEAIRAITGGE